MSTSSYDGIFALTTQRVSVPPGTTLAVIIDGTQIPGCNTVVIENLGGGSLQIVGAPSGVTLSQGYLSTVSGNHWPMRAGEAQSFAGPARFYLASEGSTSSVCVIYGLSQGS